MRALSLAVTLLLLGLTAGCGDGGASGEDPSDDMAPSVAMDAAIDRLVALQVEHGCREVWTCPSKAYSNTPFLARHADEQACRDEGILGDFLRQRYEHFAAAVDDERMRYNGAAALTCLEASRAAFDETLCVQFVLSDPSCDAIFVGQTPPNQGCIEDEECDGGMECLKVANGDCSARCIPCGETPCGPNAWCEGRATDAARCRPIKDLGELCEVQEQCGDGARFGCNIALGDADDEGICVELGSSEEDAPCSEDEHCARGLVCKLDVCVPAKIAAQGEFCALTSPIVGICGPGAVCATDANDEPACSTPRTDGEACTSFLQCAPGLQCERIISTDPTTGRCRPLRPDGSLCMLPFECASGVCADIGSGVPICVPALTCGF